MKTPRFFFLLLLLSTLTPRLSSAQGSLTPPGAPAPTMKTLDQVEARTPLVAGAPGVAVAAAGTITISQPGSYYLTKNITITTDVSGLIINADTTVDLNGFSIISTSSTSSTTAGVTLGDFQIVLKNGMIKSGTIVENSPTPSTTAGFGFGVHAAAATARNVRLSDLRVSGVQQTGILVPRVGLIERCHVSSCGGGGIIMGTQYGTVAGCVVSNCAGTIFPDRAGIRAHTVRSSTASILAPGISSYGVDATRAEHCSGYASGAGGLGDPMGIRAKLACYCSGSGYRAIVADVAVACVSEGGPIIAPQKHLGTP
jgi:hypothetical protein